MKMHIFWEAELSAYLDTCKEKIKNQIHSENPESQLNINEDQYIERLVERFTVVPVQMDFDDIHISKREELIPAERFPRESFDMERGGRYWKQVITYHIPYKGLADLLKFTPNPRILNTHEVDLRDQAVCFDIIDFHGDAEPIKRDANAIINLIKSQLANLTINIEAYNHQLPDFIRKVFGGRRQQLLNQQAVATSLGFPEKTE